MRSSLWILSVLWIALSVAGCQPPAPKDAPANKPAPTAQGTQPAPAPSAQTPPPSTPANTDPKPAPSPAPQAGATPNPAPTATTPTDAVPQPGSPEFAAAAKTAGHEGCGAEPAPAPTAAAAPAGPQHFGAAFSLANTAALPMAEALKKADEFKETPIMVSGKVATVCRKKGCWMEVDAGPGAQPVRVTFKDYGFFVPLDADGSDALMEGTLEVKTVPEAMRKHYAQDAGKTAEEIALITGDETAVKFTATAVTLTRPAAP